MNKFWDWKQACKWIYSECPKSEHSVWETEWKMVRFLACSAFRRSGPNFLAEIVWISDVRLNLRTSSDFVQNPNQIVWILNVHKIAGSVPVNTTYFSRNMSEIRTKLVWNRSYSVWNEPNGSNVRKPNQIIRISIFRFGPFIRLKSNVWNRNYFVRISDVIQKPNGLRTKPNWKAPKSEHSDFGCPL